MVNSVSTGLNAGRRRRSPSINDIRDEDTPNVYVYNRASTIFKKPGHVLLPHTSSDSHDTKVIEIPMTFNPIDLSRWAPKEELMRNGELMRQVARGVLEFVHTEEAEKILNGDEAQIEEDRLESDRLQRLSGEAPELLEDEQFKTVIPPDMMPQASPGSTDTETAGVNPSVVEAITGKVVSESHRAVLMKNLAPMMTDRDRQFVRSKTSDETIRKIVG